MISSPIPTGFAATLESNYPEHATRILEGLEQPAETSIRLNPRLQLPEVPFSTLREDSIPWLPPQLTGYWLNERPSFALDPLWHAGAYYVQDASAMAIATIISKLLPTLDVNEVLYAADLCAAPGGKSLLLRDLLPEDAILLSNEIIGKRARILEENLIKWQGGAHTLITQAPIPKLSPLLASKCHIVLVDAPCSGEGLMRREEEARRMWSETLIRECVYRQKEILQEAVHMLYPGGYLLYATCTLNKYENDEIVAWLLDHYPLIPIDLSSIARQIPNAYTSSSGIHLWPGVVRGEGQFLSVLQLSSTLPPNGSLARGRDSFAKQGFSQSNIQRHTERHRKDKYRKERGTEAHNSFKPRLSHLSKDRYPMWVSAAYPGDLYDLGEQLCYLTPLEAELTEQTLALGIPLLSSGVSVMPSDERARLTPDYSLVHSSLFDRSQIPSLTLTLDEARRYLRGETLSGAILEGTHRGPLLLTFADAPLGIGIQVGSRINNLYPKSYRLRLN